MDGFGLNSFSALDANSLVSTASSLFSAAKSGASALTAKTDAMQKKVDQISRLATYYAEATLALQAVAAISAAGILLLQYAHYRKMYPKRGTANNPRRRRRR